MLLVELVAAPPVVGFKAPTKNLIKKIIATNISAPKNI